MSELPSYRHDSPEGSLSRFREAAVVFEPTEQLNELLGSFLTDAAKERLGGKALELTLFHPPYRYKESDVKANATVAAYRRKIQMVTPHSLRVAQKWWYPHDKVGVRPQKHLYIVMQVGGTALAGAIAEEPFYRSDLPLQVFAALPKKDLLPGHELEKRRQAIAEVLHDHPGRKGIYASPHYQVGYPRVSERPIVPLRVVK